LWGDAPRATEHKTESVADMIPAHRLKAAPADLTCACRAQLLAECFYPLRIDGRFDEELHSASRLVGHGMTYLTRACCLPQQTVAVGYTLLVTWPQFYRGRHVQHTWYAYLDDQTEAVKAV
jgi:hypothetical protein